MNSVVSVVIGVIVFLVALKLLKKVIKAILLAVLVAGVYFAFTHQELISLVIGYLNGGMLGN